MASNRQQLEQLRRDYTRLTIAAKFEKALPLIQKMVALLLYSQYEGSASPTQKSKELDQSYAKLAQTLNAVAMINLQRGDTDSCLKHLKKAESLPHKNLKIKATTLNNLGCYYRKIRKLSLSLQYLKASLDIELQLNNHRNLPDCYINICAVQSSLGQHEQAAMNVMMSIILLQHEIMSAALMELKESVLPRVVTSERLSVLSLGYYNLGVECEHLNNIHAAANFYDKALEITKDFNSQNTKLLDNLERVKTKIQGEFVQKIYELKQSRKKQVDRLKTEEDRNKMYEDIKKLKPNLTQLIEPLYQEPLSSKRKSVGFRSPKKFGANRSSYSVRHSKDDFSRSASPRRSEQRKVS